MSPAEIVARQVMLHDTCGCTVDGKHVTCDSPALEGLLDPYGEPLRWDECRCNERASSILAALEAAGFVIAPVGDGWSTDMSAAPQVTPVIVELPENEVRQRDWQHGIYQIAANRGMGWISIPGMWACHPVAWCPIPTRPR